MKGMSTYGRRVLACVWAMLAFFACSAPDMPGDGRPGESYLTLRVSAGNTEDPVAVPAGENVIHSIYVYAFDDAYPSPIPDYYSDENVGANDGIHAFRMKVYDKGVKRFYVFVNPPAYVREKLVYNAVEAELKALEVYSSCPLYNIADLQQSVEGDAEQEIVAQKGFPMGNVFEAKVAFDPANPKRLRLYPVSAVPSPATELKDRIPLFRAMGKITVKAKMAKGEDGNQIHIRKMALFNYTMNGVFLPVWEDLADCWLDGGWNPYLLLDLQTLAGYEKYVEVDPFDLLGPQGEVIDSEVPRILSTFYLCQNSYGPDSGISGTWNGLEDPVGNRISKMALWLGDGREVEVSLPFLCRNDHLTVNLTVSRNGMNIVFEKWKELEVNPDWSDEIVPGPVNRE